MRTYRNLSLFAPVLATVLLTPPAAAQMFAPAPELKQLKHLEGYWEGKGEAYEKEGAEPMKWTSKISYEWRLGGHWLLEKTRIEFGPEQPMLQWDSYIGWDKNEKCFVSLAINNMTGVERMKLSVSEDGHVSGGHAHIQDGKLHVASSLLKFGGKHFDLVMYESVEGAKPFVHVKGRYAKREKLEIPSSNDRFPFPQESPEMAKLAGMCGKYRMTGKWKMGPEADAIPIAGTEHATSLYGGSVFHFASKGDPAEGMDWRYEGVGAMAWNAQRERYVMIYVNNMGESGIAEGLYHEKEHKLALFSMVPAADKMMMHRNTMTLGADGTMQDAVDETITGLATPFTAFEAKFEKQ